MRCQLAVLVLVGKRLIMKLWHMPEAPNEWTEIVLL